jgi:hypothetical protein
MNEGIEGEGKERAGQLDAHWLLMLTYEEWEGKAYDRSPLFVPSYFWLCFGPSSVHLFADGQC